MTDVDPDTGEVQTGPPAGVRTDTCVWCGEEIYDGREESGYTGEGPDWASGVIIGGRWIGGDFGCGDHPISNEDGTGPHETAEDVRRIVTEYHNGPRVCPWTSDYGQCGLQLGHEGDHLPVPGNRCTFENMGVRCVSMSGHEGDHQSEAGALYSHTDTIRSGEINTVDDLVDFLRPMVTTPNNMPVKVRARPEGYSGDSALRSVRWVEVVLDDDNDDRHVEIVGY